MPAAHLVLPVLNSPKKSDATLLHHPLPDSQLAYFANASDFPIAVELMQLKKDGWQLLVYFSKWLNKPETCYSTFDHELLAAVLAFKYFHHYPLHYPLHRPQAIN